MKNLVLALLLVSSALPAAALQLNTEDYPPFNLKKDNKVAGISSEILEEAAKRAGIPINLTLLPWERALTDAEKNADTCVYSTIRNEKREALFKWVGPVVIDEWMLFAKADSNIPKLNSLDDAKKYKVGGYNGDATTDFVVGKGVNVELVAENKLNVPKLAAGRIDLWIGTSKQGPGLAKREGKVDIKPVLTFGQAQNIGMWLACNKQVPDTTISKLNEAVKAVVKDGTAEKISKKYE